jgi:hypothetical protein
MIKASLVTFALVSFVVQGAFAAGDKTYTLSKDRTMTSVSQGSAHYAPPQFPGKGNVIFGNIGTKYPKGLYFCCLGNTISGASAGVGGAFATAIQFTPAADGKVAEIDAGVGWVQGTKSVTIGLYDDNGGVPGSVIASGAATALGGFGDCCTMASVQLKKASVTGGTPYWVVVTASGNTWDAWSLNSTDQVDIVTAAYSSDGGASWTAGLALPAPSLQVLGK